MTKTFLQELAHSREALQQTRKEPIPVPEAKKSTGFIRSLLGENAPPKTLEDKLKVAMKSISEADLPGGNPVLNPEIRTEPQDQKDTVIFDVPLLIRLFELMRESVKSDEELHGVVEKILALKDQGSLTMDHYPDIESAVKNPDNLPAVVEPANEDLDFLKQLAGIK